MTVGMLTMMHASSTFWLLAEAPLALGGSSTTETHMSTSAWAFTYRFASCTWQCFAQHEM